MDSSVVGGSSHYTTPTIKLLGNMMSLPQQAQLNKTPTNHQKTFLRHPLVCPVFGTYEATSVLVKLESLEALCS